MAQSHIEDLLTCAICLDRFKQPKQLPCQHTFCLTPCLEALVGNKSVRCPECRTVHSLPQNGAKGFPNNLTIVKLLDVPAQTKPSTDTLCQECKKKNCMVGKCLHCDKILCRECLNKHTKTLNTELGQLIAKVENRSPEVSREISGIDGKQGRLNKIKQSTLSEIEQWYDRCVSALQSKKKKLVDETVTVWNNETRILREKREKLQTELAVISSLCDNAKIQTERASSAAETTQAQKSLVEMMKETKKHLDKKVNEDRTEKYAKFCTEEGQAIIDSISKLRSISTSVRPIQGNAEGQATGQTSSPRTLGSATGFASIQTRPVGRPGNASYAANISSATTLQQYRSKGAVKKHFGRAGSDVGCSQLPWGVAVTRDDKILVAYKNNHKIQIFDTPGKSLLAFGRPGKGNGEFNNSCGVCVTSSGQIVVADTGNDRIHVLDMKGTFVSSFGKLSNPRSVAANNGRLLYVADASNNVNVFSLDGDFIRSFGNSWLSSTGCEKYLAVTNDNKVVVAETNKHRIGVFDSAGKLLRRIGERGNGAGQFKYLRGVACDRHGNIIVADSGNNRIQIFDSDGNFISSFGSEGSGPGQMKKPSGVAVLSNGDIVVSDAFNHRIQIF